MNIVAWLTEGTWESCVDAVGELTAGRPDARVTLLHVIDAHTAEGFAAPPAGLLGRAGTAPADPLAAAQTSLLAAAAARLDRPAHLNARRGDPRQQVVTVAAGADLLVCARDGDHTRLGPASLAPPTRYVVDHAPCRVLLVWPDEPPELSTLPHHPGHPPHHPPPPPPHPRPGQP